MSDKTQFIETNAGELRLLTLVSRRSNVIGIGNLLQWATPHPQLYDVFVVESFRRQGIAKRMINDILGKCKQHDKTALGLKVERQNESAIALYRSLGFQSYMEWKDSIYMAKAVQ